MMTISIEQVTETLLIAVIWKGTRENTVIWHFRQLPI
jgi:hypothetical protein